MSEVIARLNAALEGRYTLLDEVGEGGMATVFLAEDVRHRRRVALKVLKPELAAVVGSERFLSEIETTANLQHPHILPLFDSGEAAGFLFFVMPYIEGETLRDRLDHEKQLPVDEAVGIASAVAAALSVAHEQGVVHRDIKPSNILLSRGEPLVSDFGIAIAVTKSSGARLTETGLSVGTPYYMSPEQATGDREITAASDVYALGCVLYEMLVGEPPYVGSTAQAVLGKILTEKPRNPTAARASVPRNVEGALLKALEKLPADRFRTASEFARALGDPGFRYGEDAAAATAAIAAAGSARWKRVAIGLAALSALLVANTVRTALAGRQEAATPAVFQLGLGELQWEDDMAISDDGTMFAITARAPGDPVQQVWLRSLGEADFRPVPGTERATEVDFSPDGSWLVFVHDERNALLRVSVTGGGAVPILDVDSISPHDPHWGVNGTIAFTGPQGIGVVSETGEGRFRVVAPDLLHPHPRLLPDDSGILASDGADLYLVDLETDSATVILPQAVSGQYVETGHLVYGAVAGGLFAVPFDLGSHEVTGPPIPLLDGLRFTGAQGIYDVSLDGTLVYVEGADNFFGVRSDHLLIFFDREGRPDTVRMTPRTVYDPSISPDGRYVAYATYLGDQVQNAQIQILDLLTGSTPELTSEGDNFEPRWSPDGSRIAFDSRRDGTQANDLFVTRADGRGEPVRVLTRPQAQAALAWVDDETIAFEDRSSGNWDLRILSLEGDVEPRPYLEADFHERGLVVSPDGALAAYRSDETGGYEVYVRGFPEPTGKWRVSVGGGTAPLWAPSGDELYFGRLRSGEDSIFAVPVRRDPEITFGEPEFLFATRIDLGMDVHPDGRFLIAQEVDGESEPEDAGPEELRMNVVLNWFEVIRARLGRDR